jgi:putative ABC transport system ATP-binding protein
VAIARALINDPHVLLADEPTGNLDSVTGEAILELLFGIQERLGTTFIVATHDESVAERCQGLMRVHDGMLIQDRNSDPSSS